MAIKDDGTRAAVTEMRRAFYRQPDEFAERLAEVHRRINPGAGAEANQQSAEGNKRPGKRR